MSEPIPNSCPLCGGDLYETSDQEFIWCDDCGLNRHGFARAAELAVKAKAWDEHKAELAAESAAVMAELDDAGVTPLLEFCLADEESWREERTRLYALRDAAVAWFRAWELHKDATCDSVWNATQKLMELARQEQERDTPK